MQLAKPIYHVRHCWQLVKHFFFVVKSVQITQWTTDINIGSQN